MTISWYFKFISGVIVLTVIAIISVLYIFPILSYKDNSQCLSYLGNWEGQHQQSIDAISARLGDPSSLEVIESKVEKHKWDEWGYYVYTKFRARNKYNGYELYVHKVGIDLPTCKASDYAMELSLDMTFSD
jgi:hypothetical protein